MRAAVVYEHGDREKIILEDDYPEPEVSEGWVKLRVHAVSVNFHDIFSRRGMPGIKIPLPLIIGSDIAGEVVECGEGVSGVSPGDRVLVDPQPSAENGGKMIGEAFDGGRAEFCLAHASQLVPIPEGVDFVTASAIPLAYATAHRLMVTRGGIAAGEKVLILGASGGVGTASVLLAKMAGAEVIACGSSEGKLERLRELGADHVIDYANQDMRKAVWEIVGKPRIVGTGGVDVVMNSTGGGTLTDSVRCLKLGGRLLTCGATAGFKDELDLRYVWTFEQTLIGANGWRRSDIEILLDKAREGALLPVVDCVLPLSEVREADRLLEERENFGKVVIVP